MINYFIHLKLCTFFMRHKYVLCLQTDFYGEEGGQNGSFDSKGCRPLV